MTARPDREIVTLDTRSTRVREREAVETVDGAPRMDRSAGADARRRPLGWLGWSALMVARIALPLVVLAGAFAIYNYLKATRPVATVRPVQEAAFSVTARR